MKRSTLWGLLLYPVAAVQTYLLFHPERTAEFFFSAFVCLIFGVIYAFLGYMVRDRRT
jgi:hypothetical protein